MNTLSSVVRARVSGSFLKAAIFAFAVVPAWGVFSSAPARADTKVPEQLRDVGVEEHLGATVSLSELTFKDEGGAPVALSQYFSRGRPVLLNLVYYECPTLCGFVLKGFLEGLRKLDWTPGKQFEVVTLSINHREGAELAAKKKATYLEALGRPQAESGWHFLTGDEKAIGALAAQVGFRFKWDAAENQYAHPAVVFALTPDGRISRYLYGIEFKPKDLRLALLEASNGTIGTVIDRILMFCYRYDPMTRKYSLYLTRVMQGGAALTLLLFGGYLALFWRSERLRRAEPLNA